MTLAIVVLQLPGVVALNSGDSLAACVAKGAAIIAEVRARQPQARILLFADFPRGTGTPARMPEANGLQLRRSFRTQGIARIERFPRAPILI